jgi:hypothetical protein
MRKKNGFGRVEQLGWGGSSALVYYTSAYRDTAYTEVGTTVGNLVTPTPIHAFTAGCPGGDSPSDDPTTSVLRNCLYPKNLFP